MKSHAIGINKFKLKKIILEVNKYIIISLLFQSFHIQLITNERTQCRVTESGGNSRNILFTSTCGGEWCYLISQWNREALPVTAIRVFKFKKGRCESGWWRITLSRTQHIWSEHHPREIAQYACCERQASIVNCKMHHWLSILIQSLCLRFTAFPPYHSPSHLTG